MQARAAAVLGIVTGLAAEARLARALGRVDVGGGTADGARSAAERLLAAGARGLLSFGLAGGLDPALRAGDLLTPATVLVGDRAYDADPSLTEAVGAGVAQPILGLDTVAAGAGYKAMLFRATGAGAVDLESGAVAQVAARHGLPFAVLRAMCDPAQRTLTPAALVGLSNTGRIAAVAVLGALLRQPGELPGLLALARDAGAGRKSLIRRVDEIRLRGGLVL